MEDQTTSQNSSSSVDALQGADLARNEQQPAGELTSEFGLDMEEMYKVGIHFGHRISRLHPKMKPHVFGIKNTIHIIDLEKTFQKFEEALRFLKEIKQKNALILFVSTAPQHRATAKRLIQDSGMPFVVNRWLGGTLTNFPTLQKRIQYIRELEAKRSSPDFEKYTKKEKYGLGKEIDKLNKKFEGFKDLNRLPDLVFVVNLKQDLLAAKEARRKGIITMGIADTNVDPTILDYPIPANDDAIISVEYILRKVVEVLK